MAVNVSKFKEDENVKQHQPSQDEKTKIDHILRRFEQMKAKRSHVDTWRDTYQTMIDANYEPYPDDRHSSVVPLANAMIELFVAEANKMPTQYQLRAETSENYTQKRALDHVWSYDWRKNGRKKEFLDNEYITAGFGTSIIYTGFESQLKTQQDPIIQEDGSFEFKQTEWRDENIVVKNVDLRNFYIDNHAISEIEEASDCIYLQWISYERFQQFKNSPVYKNIDKVSQREYSNEYKPFYTEEEQGLQGEFVKLTHYWNVDKDVYMVLANDNVLVREHPMTSTMHGEKALPFTVRRLGYKHYSIYGRGLCEVLLMFNSEVNKLRELLMDAIRRSNSQVLALGNGLSFDGKSFSYDNEILTFDGNLQGNFEQLSGNPPNQAIFSYLDRLYQDIAMYVGIDIQNILGTPQQTAFQTEVQREASQKRINVWLANRDLAFERFANLYKDLLQQYFPRKDAEGKYPRIEVEDEKLVGKKERKFKKEKGKHIFEVDPELLRGTIKVEAYTNTSAPTINAVDREQKLGFLQSVGNILEAYQLSEKAGADLDNILPMKDTIRDLANDYNLTPEEQDTEEAKEAKLQLQKDLKAMLTGGGGQEQGGQEEGGGQGGQRQGGGQPQQGMMSQQQQGTTSNQQKKSPL